MKIFGSGKGEELCHKGITRRFIISTLYQMAGMGCCEYLLEDLRLMVFTSCETIRFSRRRVNVAKRCYFWRVCWRCRVRILVGTLDRFDRIFIRVYPGRYEDSTLNFDATISLHTLCN
jgi:hypothetical protein